MHRDLSNSSSECFGRQSIDCCGVVGSSCSKGELSLSEVVLLLLLSEGLEGALVLGQSSSESSGLLVSKVEGSSALLGLIASLVSSLLVDHSKNLSDGLSHELSKNI